MTVSQWKESIPYLNNSTEVCDADTNIIFSNYTSMLYCLDYTALYFIEHYTIIKYRGLKMNDSILSKSSMKKHKISPDLKAVKR